jgi:hypothetical protein
MPTRTRASRPRRSTARRDTRSGLLSWCFLLSIRIQRPSTQGVSLSCLIGAQAVMPSHARSDSFRADYAVQVKFGCRVLASALSTSGTGFIRVSPQDIPGHARSLLRGQTGALRLGVVLLRLRRPCGVSVPPRTSLRAAAKNAAQISSGPRQESTPWHLGAGPTRSLREG